MANLMEILEGFRYGEKTAEETNEALKEMGSTLSVDPNRNVITDAEWADTTISGDLKKINGYAYVDFGVGNPEKMMFKDGVIVDETFGEPYWNAVVGPIFWDGSGRQLGEFRGECKKKYDFNK